ncbi:mannose-1-phosphate guanylyltransferase/mannose-6-phosphate isomerase [Methylotetracoccus oryzae]|uniref:mannose-1-phosphate guanylyltransferase/mannose-6-phosphate isomerase n=1 Tax=Methylotetracoccus oryzae TaxID=1919059 RepID=UPI001117D7C5|nr:mannose-1-phosphate guanylyltransferase/mannose-6-phosphate isomerase [Methylotetracoccus oryzae]
MTIDVFPVILSGGSGTRLWPYSREAFPKQFLSFIGDQTLLQNTVARIATLDEAAAGQPIRVGKPLVICNELHRFLVAEQLREIGFESAPIVLEPLGRNTAPAMTLAALQATADGRSDPVLIVMPSDHHIQQDAEFRKRVAAAVELAANGMLVTFGIVPDRPETGYGYIRKGRPLGQNAYVLNAFVEKPDLETATGYLHSGDYLWNSGLFVMKASVWLDAIARHRPDIDAQCRLCFAEASREGDFIRVDRELFAACPSDSIDYAVMERLDEAERERTAAVLALDVGWSDLGSWSAISDLKARDADGNVTYGDVFSKDSRNCLLYAQGRFLAALGVENLVVVETTDAVLVAHKDKAQDIKVVTEYLKVAERHEHVFHRQVHRPWGNYESIDNGTRYQVKRLSLKPGATLSLQLHHHRAEHWVVVKGTARVTRGEETFLLTENESTFIPVGVRHRLENPGAIPLEIIEVQSGSYLGEDDIVRFEDRYWRAPKD